MVDDTAAKIGLEQVARKRYFPRSHRSFFFFLKTSNRGGG